MIQAIKIFIVSILFVALIAASLGTILVLLPVEFCKRFDEVLGV